MLDLQRRCEGRWRRRSKHCAPKFTRELAELDSRGVFHPDANVRRTAHALPRGGAARGEARLRRHRGDLSKGAARGPGQAGHDPGAAPSRPRTSEGPVTAAGLPNPAAVDRSKLLTDDLPFRQFVTWHRAKEKLDRQQLTQRGRPGPLPATELNAEVVRGPGAAGLCARRRGRARDGAGPRVDPRALRELLRPGNRAIDHQRDRERAAQAAHAARRGAGQGRGGAQDRPAPGKGKGEGRTAQARGRGPAAFARRSGAASLESMPSPAVAAGDERRRPQLKRRLERVWLPS